MGDGCFSPPAYVGDGCDFVAGFATFGDGSILGRCGGSWLGSTDGGLTWSRHLTDEPLVPTGFTLPVLSADGTEIHDTANLTAINVSKPANYTEIRGLSGERLVRTPTGFAVVRPQLAANVSFGGLPKPITCWDPPGKACPLRLGGGALLRLSRDSGGGHLSTAMGWWADREGAGPFNATAINALLAFHSADGGYTWRYTSTIATAATLPASEEGPSEAALEQLADGRVVCIFRTDGGDGHPDQLHAPYAVCFSSDAGHTWSAPAMLPANVGSARPMLLLLRRSAPAEGVALLLAGGRPTGRSNDPKLWIDRSATGSATATWEEYSVSAAHNRFLEQTARQWTNGTTPLPWWSHVAGGLQQGVLDRPGWPRWSNVSAAIKACEADDACVGLTYNTTYSNATNATAWTSLKGYGVEATPNASWTTWWKPSLRQPFDELVNSSDFPKQSTAYTSLRRVNESTAVLVYDQWLHHMGNLWRVYAMRIRV